MAERAFEVRVKMLMTTENGLAVNEEDVKAYIYGHPFEGAVPLLLVDEVKELQEGGEKLARWRLLAELQQSIACLEREIQESRAFLRQREEERAQNG